MKDLDKRMLSTVFEEICLANKKWKELAVELKVDNINYPENR